jgi:hypothetical protein
MGIYHYPSLRGGNIVRGDRIYKIVFESDEKGGDGLPA